MTERINYAQYAPEAMETMYNLERYIARCYRERDSFEKPLLDLIKLRVSQINGCAFCIDMHTKEARAAGETEQRLYGLNAWRET
uniref:carboxymuconolactone decarboxylase family protein n=1 Tax=Pontibacterium sp. TaxID=2036026 RepID=UPI003564C93C